MALVFRTSSLANTGSTFIKNAALTYEEGDGNFAYLLTNMSGSTITINGATTITGSLEVVGPVTTFNGVGFWDPVTLSFVNITAYNGGLILTGSLFGTASWAANTLVAQTASYITASNVYGPHGSNSIRSASFAISASWAPMQVFDTGSLLTTASVSLNTITFTKGDGSTFPITVDTGSGGGGGTVDTGSFLTTGSLLTTQQLSGSLNITGSFNFNSGSQTSAKIENGWVVLTYVSTSLDFVNDAAAAAGGVPLGGLYRNGNAVSIRIV